MRVQLLGATGTVTGSRFLVTHGDTRLLVDCGLFQGLKVLRERNWRRPPFDPASLDGVVLTHAHLDHSGMLPALIRDGYKGPVYVTRGTRDLLGVLLPDAGHLQEEDAAYANRKGFSKHKPALPLYTKEDATHALTRLRAFGWEETVDVGELSLRFSRAGHILGAAHVTVTDGKKTIVFSGDVGRPDDALMDAPTPPARADLVLMESTYGAREHPDDPRAQLAEVVGRTLDRGGIVLIPSFAVGRTQSMLLHLHEILDERGSPRPPVYVNSPMAAKATAIYREHVGDHRLSPEQTERVLGGARIVGSVEESKDLNMQRGPMVVIAASGMLTGGRVLHHLKAYGPDENNTIILPGYQAAGTRGDRLVRGERSLRIHGRDVPIRADVVQVDGFSAHADKNDLVAWLRAAEAPPKRVVLVHGEPTAADALRLLVRDELGLDVHVGDDNEILEV